MKISNEDLGGRIPLFDPRALTASQRSLYDFIDKEMVPWAESSGFKAKLPDGRFIGPFNTFLASPEIGSSFLALQSSEQKHTSVSGRVRQVVILTVGAVFESDYERYAHCAVGIKAGFSQEEVHALAEGKDTEGLSPEERLAQRFTKQLSEEHHVADDLYRETVNTFGVEGIVNIIFLAGCYYTISSLLNTFRVPVPE